MQSPQLTGSVPKKKRRPALACIHCRRRKLGCDRQRPCNNCTKASIVDCVYPETHHPGRHSEVAVNRSSVTGRRHTSRLPARTAASSSHSPLTSTSSPQTAYQTNIHNRDVNHPPEDRALLTPVTFRQHADNSKTQHAAADKPSVESLLARISELENDAAAKLAHPDRGQDHFGKENSSLATRHAPITVPGPRFGNQSSWMNNTTLVCLKQSQFNRFPR